MEFYFFNRVAFKFDDIDSLSFFHIIFLWLSVRDSLIV
jgi:hypothetical protein